MSKPKSHGAASSATGYLYQCRFALLAALQAMRETPNLDISIERFDDVAFEKDGDPVTLIQTKHHVANQGNLTDASSDLWGTLRIWSEIAKQDTQAPFRRRFILLTTGRAPDESAASFLRARDRDEKKAHGLLIATASGRSTSTVNDAGYKAFRALPESTRLALLKAVHVLDSSPNILDVRDEIQQELRFVAPREKLGLLVERLEGWWFASVIRALSSANPTAIPISAIENKIDELRDTFRRDALPVDFADKALPTTLVGELDSRPFVQQLRLIKVGPRRIEYAMRDFYRASEQRSKWAREDLLVDGEVDAYQRQLVEAWEPRFEGAKESLNPGSSSSVRIAVGQRVYEWAERDADYPFRSVRERFLTHGSFHILANQGAVGWHPDYTKHIDIGSSDNDEGK